MRLKLYEDAICSKQKKEASNSVGERAADAEPSNHLADDEPHTEPADQEGKAPDGESETAAEKARTFHRQGERLDQI